MVLILSLVKIFTIYLQAHYPNSSSSFFCTSLLLKTVQKLSWFYFFLVLWLHFPPQTDKLNHTKHHLSYKDIQTWIRAAHLHLFSSNKSRQLLFNWVSTWICSMHSNLIIYPSYHLLLIKLKTLLTSSRLTHEDSRRQKGAMPIRWPQESLLSFPHLSFPLYFHRCLQNEMFFPRNI